MTGRPGKVIMENWKLEGTGQLEPYVLNTCATSGKLLHFSKFQFHHLQDKVNIISLLDCDRSKWGGKEKVKYTAESGDSYHCRFPEESSLRQPAGWCQGPSHSPGPMTTVVLLVQVYQGKASGPGTGVQIGLLGWGPRLRQNSETQLWVLGTGHIQGEPWPWLAAGGI